jgi:hypothetical protein
MDGDYIITDDDIRASNRVRNAAVLSKVIIVIMLSEVTFATM